MPMISLQISQDLIKKLDEIQEKLEYSSRSETLRESVLFFIQEHQDSLPIIGHKIAVIVVVHEAREDILDKFSLQVEKYENIVKSVTQYNLKNKIMKNLIVAGSGEEIGDLFHELNSERLFQSSITYVIV
ncbi:CopG family ribbon-helix-helix protein [Promethearchaeum syntrophicum]|uniref:CopG family ribbon-helix-helix protein n=1 Tax=Promethearchaeum syntrophicum TaxID=2594042 RepID=A0A5B9D977_9ARCH|nr:ribbon-helix-helix protein, CopG family [Candidatus Prometheoarchaeum syntrophicum]QEE15684.1 nickel responsive regulator [Candidatus Prometheoarchaeum syntrophicum]